MIFCFLFTGPLVFAQKKQISVYYTCPMHPEIKSNQPGKCPKCGMKLIKKQLKQTTPITDQKKQPAAAVPVPKMDTKDKVDMPGQKDQVTYTCPMHAEIHATKPGNCPKCGMKLIKETYIYTETF